MLKIKNLSFAYGSIQTLNSVDMEMETGKVTCILGRNGVGKTTLLKNIMGILNPLPGSSIQMDGIQLISMAPHRRAKSGLGYVPQGRQIFPRITVEENLKVALQARRDRSRVIPGFVYDLFPVLKEMGGRMGGDLSGGQFHDRADGEGSHHAHEDTEQPPVVADLLGGQLLQRRCR